MVDETGIEHGLDRVGFSVLTERVVPVWRRRNDSEAKELVDLLICPVFDNTEELKVLKMVIVC